jgi:hypothetical protein
MKRFLKILLISLIIAVFAAAILFAVIFLKYKSLPSSAVLPEAISLAFKSGEKEKMVLGEKYELDSALRLPWNFSPDKMELSFPEGLQNISRENFSVFKTGWGYRIWKIKTFIQAYRPGDYKNIRGKLIISKNNSGKDAADIIIPEFSVSALELPKDAQINVAGKIEKRNGLSKKTLILIVSVLALAIMIFLFWKKKSKNAAVRILLPWELAMIELAKLRNSQTNMLFNTEICILKLTDIIRNYIGKCFGIEAPTMTTEEFFDNLKKTSGALSHEHKGFLFSFMNSADLVKFAKFPADKKLFEKAIFDAEVFVKSTVVPQNQENPKGADAKKEETK